MDIETAGQTAMVFGVIILALGFFWILWTISPQLLGLFFLALGIFVVAKLPGMGEYEKPEMTGAVIGIGLILIIVGILLVIPSNFVLPAMLIALAVAGTLIIITRK